jgi:hypothetical protein
VVRVLAEGKEAVLTYLEDQLVGLPGHPGRYSLAVDDRGQLVICVAGSTFIGEGETVQAGMRLTIRGGIVKHLELPPNAEPAPAPDPAGR